MSDSSVSRSAAIERAVSNARLGRSCLIRVPPLCDYGDILTEIREELCADLPEDLLVAHIDVDEVADDAGLVKALIREWAWEPEIWSRWEEKCREYLDREPDLDPQHLLQRFVVHVVQPRRVVALLDRFHKLYRGLSSELLAMMRKLEKNARLTCINVAPLTYRSLEEMRKRESVGFTSDYGQKHGRVELGPLSFEEARDLWVARRGRALETDRLERRRFETLFQVSGGLPVLFDVGLVDLDTIAGSSPDVRELRSGLESRLGELLDPLLTKETTVPSSKLVALIAGLHTGDATADLVTLQGHEWSAALLATEGDVVVPRCEILGRRALELHSANQPTVGASAAQRYENGDFPGAELAAEHDDDALLRRVSRLSRLVFGYAPRTLYFAPSVPWAEVADLARSARDLCRCEDSREELEFWDRVATLHSRLPRPEARAIERWWWDAGERGIDGIDDSVLQLALRWAACRSDPYVVSRAHTAIPLVEDTLRHYLVLVLRCEPSGEVFRSVDDDALAKWWDRPEPFHRPESSAALTGATLCMAVAVLSDREGSPLFDDSRRVSQLIQQLDRVRNLLGHTVVTPSATSVDDFIRVAGELLKRYAQAAGSREDITVIRRLARPPRAFLGEIVRQPRRA